MKPLHLILALLLGSCHSDRSVDPINGELPQDELEHRITDGIFIRLDSLMDTYSLDETIRGHLIFVNQSDSTPFVLHVDGYPPWHWYSVFDSNNEYVYFEPTTTGFADQYDTLSIGDSINASVYWYQNLFDHDEIYSAQKVFAGRYRLESSVRTLDKYLTKWITISEVGYPFAGSLKRDYSLQDSIKLVFVLRNRVSKAFQVSLPQDPFQLVFTKDEDTVLQMSLSGPNELTIPAFSDNIMFEFSRSKADSIFQSFSGGHWVSGVITLDTLQITRKNFIIFP